ncbi:hypothetical protein V1264_010682 [Littorina saxatilis]|uniref:Uncharacterized protein n=2 Tax=Littorina saxatilis TaxID=31220 RepID=A0AAN9G1X2_9CAEN
MAAPTLPEKSNNTVKKKQEKQPKKQDTGSVRKVSKKNILLPPFQLEWPEVEADVEERILEALIL